MNENDFLKAVSETARLFHWKIAHFGNTVKIVRKGSGYEAIPDVGAAGFPDLVLCRERVLFAELKVRGKPTPAQQEWLDALTLARVEAYFWTPNDWDEIETVLS